MKETVGIRYRSDIIYYSFARAPDTARSYGEDAAIIKLSLLLQQARRPYLLGIHIYIYINIQVSVVIIFITSMCTTSAHFCSSFAGSQPHRLSAIIICNIYHYFFFFLQYYFHRNKTSNNCFPYLDITHVRTLKRFGFL